jgi:hypothetical protein
MNQKILIQWLLVPANRTTFHVGIESAIQPHAKMLRRLTRALYDLLVSSTIDGITTVFACRSAAHVAVLDVERKPITWAFRAASFASKTLSGIIVLNHVVHSTIVNKVARPNSVLIALGWAVSILPTLGG